MIFEVRILTTDRVREVTWLVVCQHQINVAEGKTGMTMTCMMSSATEMRAPRSKTGVKNETALNKSDATRGTMIIMAPSMSNLTDSALLMARIMKESKPFPMT
jgi:hypothetical protein